MVEHIEHASRPVRPNGPRAVRGLRWRGRRCACTRASRSILEGRAGISKGAFTRLPGRAHAPGVLDFVRLRADCFRETTVGRAGPGRHRPGALLSSVAFKAYSLNQCFATNIFDTSTAYGRSVLYCF